MSHAIRYLTFHCSESKTKILKEINSFAYDPEERSGYHGNLKFHDDIICKNEEEARAMIDKLDKGWYDDHAVYFKIGRKKYWLVKIEYHC